VGCYRRYLVIVHTSVEKQYFARNAQHPAHAIDDLVWLPFADHRAGAGRNCPGGCAAQGLPAFARLMRVGNAADLGGRADAQNRKHPQWSVMHGGSPRMIWQRVSGNKKPIEPPHRPTLPIVTVWC